MTIAWTKFHLLLRHDSVFLPIFLEDMACTLLTTNNGTTMLQAENSPCYSNRGSERCFHASSLPCVSRKAGSSVASLRLLGRRAPA